MALLPPVEWRKLPVRIINATSLSVSDALNIVYDMLTGSVYYNGADRVIGSGSAWSASGKFTTGSNTEAFWCYPPTMTAVSQSIMFAAKNMSGSVSTAAPAMVPGENLITTVSTTPTAIGIACIKNASGSFTQWTSLYPFESGSYSTGYVRATAHLSSSMFASKFIIYESKETLAFMHYYTSIPCLIATIAGAVIDPEQSAPTSSADAEVDGRIYGVIGSSTPTNLPSAGVLSNFLTTNDVNGASFLSNSTTTNATVAYGKSAVFYPNINSLAAVSTDKFRSDANVVYNTLSGELVTTPLKCYINTANNQFFLGRLRDISVTRDIPLGDIVTDFNGTLVGYALSHSEVASGDTIMFRN